MNANRRLIFLCRASIVGAVLALGAGMSIPRFVGFTPTDPSMLSVHLLMEFFAIIIAMLVVVVSWHTFNFTKVRSANLLVCGFMIVACCDLLHALTYAGMPAFLTPSGTTRAIFFWLIGRSVEVVTMMLLAVAWVPPLSRLFWLCAGMAGAVAVVWVGSYHIDYFPQTFVSETGVTSFKAGYEYLLCVLYVVTAALFWRRAGNSGLSQFYLLAVSAFVMGVGEIMFTSYVTPSDFQNVFGHGFKIFSYALLYRATFVASLRIPYEEAIEAQLRMRDSEQKLRALYELSPLGITLTDMSGRLLEFNRAFERICGYPGSELKQLDYRALTPERYAADDARQLEVLQTGGVYGPYEKEYVRSDGSLVPVRLNGMLLAGNDGRNYIWSIIEDITDIRVAAGKIARDRLRLETILRTASDGIHILDSDGLLIEANDAFLNLLGYGRDVIGRLRIADWDAQDDADLLKKRNAGLMGKGESVVFETLHRRSDGTLLEVEISACGIEIEGRKFLYASSRDISARKKVEADLARLNAELEIRVAQRTAELEAVNKELNSFSYTVAHDLRAPVRAIDGYSAMLLNASAGKLDADAAGYLGRIVASSRRMGALIDDLLAMARISRHEMHQLDFDLSELAAAAVAVLKDANPDRAVTVSIQPGMMVRGDAGLMKAALENLLGNAWKFTAKTAAASIEFGANRVDGRTIYFVRDNGAGFDMQYAHKLFEPFQRLHHRHEFEGTGIGLATVKKIIGRHGGSVWVDSAVNSGTTLFFTLG